MFVLALKGAAGMVEVWILPVGTSNRSCSETHVVSFVTVTLAEHVNSAHARAVQVHHVVTRVPWTVQNEARCKAVGSQFSTPAKTRNCIFRY